MKKPEEILSKYIFDSNSIDGLSYEDTITCMKEHAEQLSIEFTNWYRNTAFEKTMNKPTTLLYEQFMLEQSCLTQKE